MKDSHLAMEMNVLIEIITTINENIDFEETLEDVLEMEESFDALFSADDNENN